jgi:hypothetical protein
VGRADIDLIGSAAAVLAFMLYGAAGFYLGIDLPPVPPDHRMHLPLLRGLGSSWNAVELLSAAGTFLAAVAAVVSVFSIILDETERPGTALLISFTWMAGTTMQIVASIIARTRASSSPRQLKFLRNDLWVDLGQVTEWLFLSGSFVPSISEFGDTPCALIKS